MGQACKISPGSHWPITTCDVVCPRGVSSGTANLRCVSIVADCLFKRWCWITFQARAVSSLVESEAVFNSLSPISKTNLASTSSSSSNLELGGSVSCAERTPLAPIRYTSICATSDYRTSGWLSASVAGEGNLDNKSALPFSFPGLYSKVYVHALKT